MPRMPGALWRPTEFTKRRMDRYDIFCIHTIVGYAPAEQAHFSTTADGDIIQSRDTLYQSAANLDGNHRVIASENEDHGPRFGGTPRLPDWVPLTPEQVEANAEIYRWLNDEHGIPLQLCPDSRPASRGLAYHRQGIDGNFGNYRYPGRVAGGELWTKHFGKVCPTDVRIAQLPHILARTRQLTQQEDFDMADLTPEQREQLVDDIAKRVSEISVPDPNHPTKPGLNRKLTGALVDMQRDLIATRGEITDLKKGMAAVATVLADIRAKLNQEDPS